MADFIDLINDETLLASDPHFSREAVKVYVEKEEKNYLKKEMKSYPSNTTYKVQDEKDDTKEIKCPVCEKKHDLDNCKFNNMSADERWKRLRRKRLCYVCYLPVSPGLQEKESMHNLCNEASNWITWVCINMESCWNS